MASKSEYSINHEAWWTICFSAYRQVSYLPLNEQFSLLVLGEKVELPQNPRKTNILKKPQVFGGVFFWGGEGGSPNSWLWYYCYWNCCKNCLKGGTASSNLLKYITHLNVLLGTINRTAATVFKTCKDTETRSWVCKRCLQIAVLFPV